MLRQGGGDPKTPIVKVKQRPRVAFDHLRGLRCGGSATSASGPPGAAVGASAVACWSCDLPDSPPSPCAARGESAAADRRHVLESSGARRSRWPGSQPRAARDPRSGNARIPHWSSSAASATPAAAATSSSSPASQTGKKRSPRWPPANSATPVRPGSSESGSRPLRERSERRSPATRVVASPP